MKFRKKPVVIEAVQFKTPMPVSDAPQWLVDALLLPVGTTGRAFVSSQDELVIATLEGDITAQHGDWIIRGVRGELYPCKPDIFEATYDPEPDGDKSS